MFYVVQDDVIVSQFDTVEDCNSFISDTLQTQKIALLSRKKIMKAFFKKNVPLNLSQFRIFTEVKQ